MKIQEHLIEKLFDPEIFGVMNLVCYASGSGTNFREGVLESREPGANFVPGLLVTDKKYKKGKNELIGAINYASDFGIPRRAINGFSTQFQRNR